MMRAQPATTSLRDGWSPSTFATALLTLSIFRRHRTARRRPPQKATSPLCASHSAARHRSYCRHASAPAFLFCPLDKTLLLLRGAKRLSPLADLWVPKAKEGINSAFRSRSANETGAALLCASFTRECALSNAPMFTSVAAQLTLTKRRKAANYAILLWNRTQLLGWQGRTAAAAAPMFLSGRCGDRASTRSRCAYCGPPLMRRRWRASTGASASCGRRKICSIRLLRREFDWRLVGQHPTTRQMQQPPTPKAMDRRSPWQKLSLPLVKMAHRTPRMNVTSAASSARPSALPSTMARR